MHLNRRARTPRRFSYLQAAPFILSSALLAPAASAAADYWDGTGTSWNAVANWSTSPTATTPNPATIPGAADTAIFNISTLNTSQTLTLDATQSISNLTINTTGALILAPGAIGSLSIGAGGINNNANGTHTITANIALAANQTWTDSGTLKTSTITCGANLLTVNTTGNTQLNGAISGTQGLVKNGAGNLSLAGINTFSGPVAVNAGTFIISFSNALGSATSVTVANGAALELSSSPNNSSAALSLSGAGILATGALIAGNGTINVNNPINTTQAGNFAVGGTGTITLGGAFGVTGLNSDVTKVSSNTLILSGAADNVGMGLELDAGTVVLAKASSASVHAIGADGININGGTLQLGGIGGDQIYDGAEVSIFGGSFDANGLSETAAFFDMDGGLGVNNSGSILNSAAGNATLTSPDGFEIDSDAAIGVTQSTATLTLNGAINNFNQTANLTKVGLGTLIINGPLTLGPSSLTISAGTFISPSTLTANAVVNFGTFIYNGGAFNSRLVNSNILVLNADFAPSNGLDNEASFTLSAGRILATGGLGFYNGGTFTLNGGTLILSSAANANNTNAGTFVLNGAFLNGPATFNNAAAGIITGNGAIAAPLTNAGTLSPTGGTLTVPAFTNNGIVEMTSATAPLAGGAIANAGTIEGVGQINNAITNTGTIESTGGNLVFTSSVSSNGTLRASTGTKLLFQNGGFPINLGLISLTGGTLDTGSSSLINGGQITGYGTLAVGGPVGLLNNGNITFTGGTTTINANISNSASKRIDIKYQPAIFTGNITNNGTIKTTSTTVTFTGPYTGNTFISDPATNIFQSTAIITPGGSMTGSAGDVFSFSDTFTNNGNFTNGGNLSVSTAIINTGTFTQTGPITTSANATFTNTAGLATFAANAKLAALTITAGTVDITSSKFVIEPTNKSTTLTALQSNLANHSLISSTLPPNFALALMDNAALNLTTFGGLPADPNSLLLSAELLGDANADGHVDLTDLSTILNNFGTTTPAWTSGNFDNAPTIDLTDLSDVLNNFGQSNPNASSSSFILQPSTFSTPTPEPASLCIAATALSLLVRRRKS